MNPENLKNSISGKAEGETGIFHVPAFLIVLGCVFANVVANHDPQVFISRI